MKSRYIILSVLACLLIGCESGFVVSNNCIEGDTKEENDVKYICVAGDINNIKEEDNIQVSDSFTYWKPAENCLNGVDETGKCTCSNECVNGCDATGACKCSLTCTNGCDATGETCCQDNCQNGCNSSGTCLCPKECTNGCDVSGKACCDNKCKNGCELNGTCSCPDSCKYGCNDNGTCDEACKTIKCQGENEQCQNGACIDLCKSITCPDAHYCSLGICLQIDTNHNHLHDKYETAPKQGEPCRKSADCDSSAGKGDGFCDSFIGYKCATKCTLDEQCTDVSGGGYHYVCRPDGRCAPDKFISVWNLPADDTNVTITLYASQTSTCTIDWGDGKSEQLNVNGQFSKEHNYAAPGKVTITISEVTGDLKFGVFDINTDVDLKRYVQEIKAFGPLGVGISAFRNASNFTKVSQVDIPRSDLLTSLNNVFGSATSFNDDIGNWDTSNVNDLIQMFHKASMFNQDIGKWDTSNVTRLESTFRLAIAFNQDIGNWDTSKVTNMFQVFEQATVFNQNIAQWDTSNVTTMEGMFRGAAVFNQNIAQWDTSKVKKMGGMFYGATEFNQNISKWNTSNLNDLTSMFNNAIEFDQDLSSWDISKVKEAYSEIIGDKTIWHNINVFYNSNISEENYCNIAKGWKEKGIIPGYLDITKLAKDKPDIKNINDLSNDDLEKYTMDPHTCHP